MQIANAQNLPPDSTTRTVTLVGHPLAIASAKAEIGSMIEHAARGERSSGKTGAGNVK
jgi:hypothetical protein